MYDLDQIQDLTNLKSVDFHSQLGSTNDRAIELIKQNQTAYPALVLTETQTAGRGQRNRQWWSGEGSLTFSWVISVFDRPGNEVSISLTPAAVAIAVAESLEEATELHGIQIKWPNDLLVMDRKICGILIETVPLTGGQAIVVGVGINVNNPKITPEHFASAIQRPLFTPTSVLMETQQETSLTQLLIRVLGRLEIELDCLVSKPARIIERCNQRLFLRGETVRVTRPGRGELAGICQGISESGGLILATINGTEVVFSGTIEAV